MINSKNIINVIETIIRPNIAFILIIFSIIILSARYLDTNVIFIISILLFTFVYYKEIINTFNELVKKEKKTERIIEDNHRTNKELYINEKLNNYLKKLRKYRKYNPESYDSGYDNMKMFLYTLHDLEKHDISHPKQYFENAQLYLKKSINYFQSITISVPEEKYIHSLKYNKFEPNKLSNRIGMLCKKIYKYSHDLLFNLSLRFNEKFYEKPDIYKCEIDFNVDNVEESNTFNSIFELY